MSPELEFDEIGYWSEIKLEIVRDYAAAYSQIMTAKKFPHVYIDAFAGAGRHISKRTGDFVPGSPLNALAVVPPFREYYLIDLDAARVGELKRIIGRRQDVQILAGDCNRILVDQIYPRLGYETYRRALCLLDPYGVQLDWNVVFQAGQLRTIDMFLNFPVMGMNRTALWRSPEKVRPEQMERLTCFWGDQSWKEIAYTTERSLFQELEKEPNEKVVEGYRQRLMTVAGFRRVPQPIPMRNSRGATVYYLFFASQADVAEHIVNDIFRKYRNAGGL